MVQYKKEDIKNKIDAAALSIFAKKGYENTAISDIAKTANVSIGNIYRYYKGKDDIFYSIVPEHFICEFKETLLKKVASAKDVLSGDIRNSGLFLLMNEEFIEFMVSNRERMMILFMGSRGTRYEPVKEEAINYLIMTVQENYSGKDNNIIFDSKNYFIIKTVYTNLIEMMISTLREFQSISEIKALLQIINSYHLFGVTYLFK